MADFGSRRSPYSLIFAVKLALAFRFCVETIDILNSLIQGCQKAVAEVIKSMLGILMGFFA